MLQIFINEAKEKMNGAIERLEHNLSTISTGMASPKMLQGIKVNYYEEFIPVDQMATISVQGARQLVVKPFDRTQLEPIVAAIHSANIGLNANNEGELIRINIPALTEETRKREAKKIGCVAEEAKIIIRNIRQDANNKIKASEGTDDDKKGFTEDIQELTKDFNSKVDSMAKEKEKNILEL